MNLPYSVKLPVIIGLLLLGAAAFTHAHEARKDDVAQVSKQSALLLEVVPIMGPPVAFKNGQFASPI